MTGQRFDSYLPHVNASELNTIARLWGARGQMRKAECIQTILRGLDNPAQVQQVLARLQPFQRTALALLRQAGGRMDARALEVGLRISGVPVPRSQRGYGDYGYYGASSSPIAELLRQGLVLLDQEYDPASQYYLSYSQGRVVFSDERLLAQVGPPELEPLPVRPGPPPETSICRHPSAVTLDIIAVLQAIQQMGGLALTQHGRVRAAELRKLHRVMGWPAQGLALDGLVLPEPAAALVGALRAAGVLAPSGEALALTEPPETFASRPSGEPVAILLRGFIHNTWWSETSVESWEVEEGRSRRSSGRWALTLALAALPPGTEGFVTIDDLDQAMFDRIGSHFSLGYLMPRYSYSRTGQTPEDAQDAEARWRTQRRAGWLERERPWLERALSTWLYYLGLVELGTEDDTLASFRLTDLGRAVFHPESHTPPAGSGSAPQAAWLVQPNFEVVVYLDRATPQQLAFLERHAQRTQAQQHTAHYSLTREAVYQTLESGATLEDLVSGLQAGSATELPQNVVTELREWAAMRDQVTLHRQGHLLEFPSDAARRAGMAAGLSGTVIGDRYLLVRSQDLSGWQPRHRVDYTRPMSACLSLTEEGAIKLTRSPRDLLLEAQLSQWAEPRPGSQGEWQITGASVRAAVRGGHRLTTLFSLLEERLTSPLPPLLAVALRAWAGTRLDVGLGPVTVLHCPRPEVREAIAASQRLKPYLGNELAPGVFLVDSEQLALLKKELAWAGLEVTDIMVIGPNRQKS